MQETDATTITSLRVIREFIAFRLRRSSSSLMAESFLNISIRAGDIRLRLVIIEVGDVIIHRVIREKNSSIPNEAGPRASYCGEITSVGLFIRAIRFAIVNVLPLPVTPSRA